MALQTITSTVTLDVYNHDQTIPMIKAIAGDSETRFVNAYLLDDGSVYNPDMNATVYLMGKRPDGTTVISNAEVVMLYEAVEEGDNDIYGLHAEIPQEMLFMQGMIMMQFKMVLGDQILRTSMFKVNNGAKLDDSNSNPVNTD